MTSNRMFIMRGAEVTLVRLAFPRENWLLAYGLGFIDDLGRVALHEEAFRLSVILCRAGLLSEY